MARWPGFSELLRRICVALLVAGAFAGAGGWPWPVVVASALCAVAVYIWFPRPHPPEDALRYETAPSQTVPDWMGFILSGVFFALPIWAVRADPGMGPVHPAAALTWPLALIFSAFWMIGASYAAWWLVLGRDGLTVHSFRAERTVPYAAVRAVSPYRKDLPRWIRALTPLLIFSGNYGAAGAVTLARPARGVVLELAGGDALKIQTDNFKQGARALDKALAAHGLAPDKKAG